MKIPDEIVREAERAWEATPGNRFHAALAVAAKWAVEECAQVAENPVDQPDRWNNDGYVTQYQAPPCLAAAIRKLAGGNDECNR